MSGFIFLGIVAFIAATGYTLYFHGSSLQFTAPSIEDPARRREDAARGLKILGDMGGLLRGHRQSIDGLLAAMPRQADTPADDASVREVRHAFSEESEQAASALRGQAEMLGNMSAPYGDLFGNEIRNIDNYCEWTQKLRDAFDGIDEGGNAEAEKVAVALARKMLQENDRLRARISGCENQISAMMSDMSRLQREARTDSLTKLPNRRAWDDRLEACEGQESQVFVMIDLDRFKQINDTHGHSAGDGVLTLVATIMRNTPDVEPFRLAGDEFAMITSPRHWKRLPLLLEALRTRVEKASLNTDGTRVQVTVSIGAAMTLEGESFEQTLHRADEALYRSKGQGGNRIHLHDGATVATG